MRGSASGRLSRARREKKEKLIGEIAEAADLLNVDILVRGLRNRLRQLSLVDLTALERLTKLAYQAGYNRAEASKVGD